MSKQFYFKKGSKYHNEPITVDGMRFDGKLEHRRWCFLKLMERAGEITNLRYHVKYTLFPKGTVDIRRLPNGKEIVLKTYEREHWYEADFVYVNKKREEIVEDFKGFVTEAFTEKKAMMKSLYNIDVKVVKQINELTF